MKIGELFVQLGFRADQTKLREFIGGIGELSLSSVLAAAGVGAVGVAFAELADKAAHAGGELRNFRLQTGGSIEDLQAFRNVAEQLGLSVGEVDGDFKRLQDTIAKIKFEGQNNMGLAMLGIDPTGKSVRQILVEAQKKMRSLTPENQRVVAQYLGISEAMLTVFNSTADLNSELDQQLVLTRKEAEALGEVDRALKAVSQTLRTMSFKGVADLFQGNMRKLKNLAIFDMGPAVAMGLGQRSQAIDSGISKGVKAGANIAIHIDGAKDPMAVGKEVYDALKKLFSDTEYQATADNR